jgi:RimJ/RimL family protein N-acetyltransferase
MEGIDYRTVAGRRDADVKSLAALSVLDNGNPETLADAVEHFRGELTGLDPAERLLVAAFAGAEIVGFCRFQLCKRLALWWCRGLVVATEWQRRGIGASLLRAAIERLACQGVRDVRSDTASTNAASRAAHLKAGFRLVAMQGEDFCGRRREDHCFYQRRPEQGAVTPGSSATTAAAT